MHQAASGTVSFSEHWRKDVDNFLAGKMPEDFVIRDRRRCVGGSYHRG